MKHCPWLLKNKVTRFYSLSRFGGRMSKILKCDHQDNISTRYTSLYQNHYPTQTAQEELGHSSSTMLKGTMRPCILWSMDTAYRRVEHLEGSFFALSTQCDWLFVWPCSSVSSGMSFKESLNKINPSNVLFQTLQKKTKKKHDWEYINQIIGRTNIYTKLWKDQFNCQGIYMHDVYGWNVPH